ncbi:hypothetical protein I4F81_006725 [Pyropia yezoensis]|uniref:Uncharacterized protein n=1 Tax=Pyropia yezoensis TaxID=2788 RepID=A0ACC3C223_PYRYE|nr:hypothetical protein I4F81_006725 [Neopyropia yezoensis]
MATTTTAVASEAAAAAVAAAAATTPHPQRRRVSAKRKPAADSNWARLRDAAAVADVEAGRKRPPHLKPRRRLVAPPPRPPPGGDEPGGGVGGERERGAPPVSGATSGVGRGGGGGADDGAAAKRGRTAGGAPAAAGPAAPKRCRAAAASAPPATSPPSPAPLLPTPSSMVTDLSLLHTTSHILAMDCEMVGVGPGGKESALARVSIVDSRGAVVLDTHVVVDEPVTDYRTWVSGILPHHVAAGSPTANSYAATQRAVADLIKGRILVGHALHNDMKSLMLDHPRRMTRDTSLWYKKHGHGGRKRVGGRRTPPALRKLATTVLGIEGFQKGEHDSVGDARVTLALYKKSSKRWETELRERRRC